ncbi:hypothetical protein [Desulfonatronum lacustre]|uniref:hypothetical protein n=1 Tax=Desulfonatronum lacustre TaxID=66849 RepID=UPI0004B0A290|nr:hypothetical protein [Desulfonatronum lacustre]
MLSVIGVTPIRIFWVVFFVLAVWLQLFFPGTDFFVSGIILCLQRERFRHVLALILPALLIQEGAGALVFGAGLLRYGGLVGMFLIGRGLFEARSPVFILLLAAAFALAQMIILHTMAGLQSMNIQGQRLFLESLTMFATTVLGWWFLDAVYRFISRHASQS